MLDKKSKIDKYVDTTGQLSSRKLLFGTWYLKHKVLFREIGIGLLIAWCVVFVGFSLWKWGDYLFFGYWADQEYQLKESINTQNYFNIQNLYKAQNLLISDVRIFPTAEDMYDLSASIQNPNEKWIAKVSYHFIYSGGESGAQSATIMPMSKRPLFAFGIEVESFPSNVNFVIDNIEWQAVDAHKIGDVKEFLAERNFFTVNNLLIDLPTPTGVSVPSLSFDFANQSAFSYWEPVFFVELLNGNQVVGYINLYFDKIVAFSTENVALRYFNSVAQFDNIKVVPTIDYFNDNIYIDPGDL